MHKFLVVWLLLIGMPWTSSALADSGIMISAIEPPAWMQQGDSKTALTTGDEIQLATRLLTGSSGKLSLQLGPEARLQLDLNSEIELVAAEDSATATASSLPAIKIYRGHACVQYRIQPAMSAQFNLLIGDTVKAKIHEHGDICVNLNEGMSSVALHKGSVQIANLIEPAMVVLSEEGSEYRFDNTGYFELGKFEKATSIEVRNVAAAKAETQTPDQKSSLANAIEDTAKAGVMAEDTAGVSQPVSSDTASKYVYTVYLFSTRSQEVASELHQKLRADGHESLIITSEDATVTRYRVAVSGFASRKAAQDYAAAIVGTHGIADTWIGRQRDDR